MADLLLSPALHLVLYLCGVSFTVIAVRRNKLLWSVPAALCTIGACLLGLAAERSLEQLLIAVLVPTIIVLFSQTDKEGVGEK